MEVSFEGTVFDSEAKSTPSGPIWGPFEVISYAVFAKCQARHEWKLSYLGKSRQGAIGEPPGWMKFPLSNYGLGPLDRIPQKESGLRPPIASFSWKKTCHFEEFSLFFLFFSGQGTWRGKQVNQKAASHLALSSEILAGPGRGLGRRHRPGRIPEGPEVRWLEGPGFRAEAPVVVLFLLFGCIFLGGSQPSGSLAF